MTGLSALKEAEKIQIDKGPHYLAFYDELFTPLRNAPLSLLELGVYRGESLRLWKEYFRNGRIYGIDSNPPTVDLGARVRIANANQVDLKKLAGVFEQWHCSSFDIIIDDASHIGNLTATSFAFLFSGYLRPGGLYIIEDWGTGYWHDFPDGERLEATESTLWRRFSSAKFPPYNKQEGEHKISSHTAGMPGFIKLLIDCLAGNDIKRDLPSFNVFGIEEIRIKHGIVAVYKS